MKARSERRGAGTQTLLGLVASLSRSPDGSRMVQEALEVVEARGAIAAELHGHVCELMVCPHGNFVLQKCISALAPSSLQFVVDELLAAGPRTVAQMARHRFASRIFLRLQERLPAEQMSAVLAPLIEDAEALSTHAFGNFTVSHVLEFGTAAQRRQVFRTLREALRGSAPSSYACAVLARALSLNGEEQLLLGRAILDHEGLLAAMASSRHGSVAVKNLLKSLPRPQWDEAQRQLQAHSESLQQCRYGRAVMKQLAAPPQPSPRRCALGGA